MQQTLFARALAFREEHTQEAGNYDAFKQAMEMPNYRESLAKFDMVRGEGKRCIHNGFAACERERIDADRKSVV